MTQNYLPKDGADYPKTSATRTFMVQTAERAVEEYEAAMADLPGDARLTKKTLAIQRAMAQQCATFAAMGFNSGTWEEQLRKRSGMLTQQGILQQYEEALSGLTADERGAFIQYAHTSWFLHNAFIDKHLAALRTAYEKDMPERAFEDKIILGTIYSIAREWRRWWLEHGTAAFDQWTYEDSPWEVE